MNRFSYLFCLLFIAIFSSCKKSDLVKITEIDGLKTQEEVQNFIRKNFKDLSDFEVERIQDFKNLDYDYEETLNLANKIGVDESFYKSDFDNNGFTDLLVIGDRFSYVVVMNFGNQKYLLVQLPPSFDDRYIPKVTSKNGLNLLEIYRVKSSNPLGKIVPAFNEKKLLAYKFGDFIEYNTNTQNFIPIKKIEFSTSGCFGTCPIFDLEINQNQEAKFLAKHFNFNESGDAFGLVEDYAKNEGTFETKIKAKDYDELIKLLEYIDFPKLEDHYAVNWTDDQTVILRITYGDGKVKTIQDYGARGTFGMKKVYKILFDFRKNQDWKRLN